MDAAAVSPVRGTGDGARSPSIVELELHRIELKYASLRIVDRARLSRLVASLAEIGQQSPVLTVVAADRHVLIDGYRRVAALRLLGRDCVKVLVWELGEAEALVERHRLAAGDKRSALEDGWLLRELHEVQEISQQDLAIRFVRSPSWVSRRLALVRELPEALQELVRRGTLGAHIAMKYLVPVARANWEQAETLGAAIATGHLSTRQVAEVYAAWKGGTPEQRERVAAQPLLFVKAAQAARDQPASDRAEQERELVKDIERLGSVSRRARRTLAECCRGGRRLSCADLVAVAWNDAERGWEGLKDLLLHGVGGA